MEIKSVKELAAEAARSLGDKGIRTVVVVIDEAFMIHFNYENMGPGTCLDLINFCHDVMRERVSGKLK